MMDNRVSAMLEAFKTWPVFTEQLMGSITDQSFSEAIPDEVLKKVRRVIVTGCGDSYAASLATKTINEQMFGSADYHVLRTIDVSRNYVFHEEEDLKQTLVIVISVSGSGARVTEAMMRARTKGCSTLAVTGNPQSRMALAAEYVYTLNIPKSETFSWANQTKNYFSAILTTTLFGMHAGCLLGKTTPEEVARRRGEIQSYVNAAAAMLDDTAEVIDRVSDRFKDSIGFDFIGGGADFATAYFGTAKLFEAIGALCCLNDSEDWCHINFFMRNRDRIGSVAVATKCGNSFSRTVETVASMQKSGRDVLVVTDAGEEEFIEGVTVCKMPATDREYIAPLMNYIPLCMLGCIISQKNNLEYFGGTGPENPLFSQDGGINTIKSSKIEIY